MTTPSTLTTRDILHIIPLDEQVRTKMLTDYPDHMDYDQTVSVEELAWDIYYLYFDLIYQNYLKEELANNLQVMTDELHDRMIAKTQEQLSQRKEQLTTNDELDSLRHQLQTIALSDK